MKRFNRLWALLLSFALLISFMPAMAFAEGDGSWNAYADNHTNEKEVYLPEDGGSVDLNVIIEGGEGLSFYYHWLRYVPEVGDDDFCYDENGNKIAVDNVTEVEPLTVSSPGYYYCQVRESEAEGHEGDWRTVRFNVREAGADVPSDSWYIGNGEYTEITYDPETDDTVTLEGEIINGEDFNLCFEWYSIEYNEDGEPVEELLSGEDGTSITVDAHPCEYRFVVIDNDNDRSEYVTFFVSCDPHSGDYDTDVASIEYIPSKRIEIYENTKGYEYEGAYGTEPFWLYNEYNNFAREGDTIKIVHEDDTEETFVYQYDYDDEGWCYLSDSGNRIYDGDLSTEDDQVESGGWTIGENHFTLYYQGVSCQVPIYIVENNVTKIEYSFVNGLEFVENVDCWENEDGSLQYRCEWREGDVLTVFTTDHPEGIAYTLKETIRPDGQELWFEDEDGNIIDCNDVSVTDNQGEVQWSKDDNSNNIVTVTYAGKTFTAHATIVDQVIKYYEDETRLLSDDYYIDKYSYVNIETMEGFERYDFEVTSVDPAEPDDSRFSIKYVDEDEIWRVTPKEKGTFGINITHTDIEGEEITDTVYITFTDEEASVDVDRTDSTIRNHDVLPGQSVPVEASCTLYKAYKNSDGTFDCEEITSGFTYKWVFCNEKTSNYATIDGATSKTATIKIKEDIDPAVLRKGITIEVKAEAYYNGSKIANSDALSFEVRDHYYCIEPEELNRYLVPNDKKPTKFTPKLIKYSYKNGEVITTDCNGEFELEYDDSELEITDADGNPASESPEGPYYITRLTDDDCELEISGFGDDTPSIGHTYLFDYMINIEKAKISGIVDKVYNGKNQTQKPTIKVYDEHDGGWGTLTSKEYTATYANRKYVGKASVQFTGKGQYYGKTPKKYFKINPKPTSMVSVTPASKGFTAKWKKLTTQTTGYQLQYSTSSRFSSGNKTLTITKNTINYKKVTGLKASKRYYVRVRTYKTVKGVKYYSKWSLRKYATTKR